MTIDDAFIVQKPKPAANGGKATRRGDRGQPEGVQGLEKGTDRVLRHLSEVADLALPEILLKFFQIAPVRVDGIAGEAAFDADMIKIALD